MQLNTTRAWVTALFDDWLMKSPLCKHACKNLKLLNLIHSAFFPSWEIANKLPILPFKTSADITVSLIQNECYVSVWRLCRRRPRGFSHNFERKGLAKTQKDVAGMYTATFN